MVITLPYTTSYEITQPETIAVNLPASLLRSDAPIAVSNIVASPEWARWPPYAVHPIVIQPRVGRVSLATNLQNESNLQNAGASYTIELTLDEDTWVPSVGTDPALCVQLVRGLTSSSTSEATGWNAITQDVLAFLAASATTVHRISDQVVLIDVPFITCIHFCS